jgi:hypothetical protein
MEARRTSWAPVVAVALGVGALLGAGGLVAVLLLDGELASLYALAGLVVLVAAVRLASPHPRAPRHPLLSVVGLTLAGAVTAGATAFAGFALLYAIGS